MWGLSKSLLAIRLVTITDNNVNAWVGTLMYVNWSVLNQWTICSNFIVVFRNIPLSVRRGFVGQRSAWMLQFEYQGSRGMRLLCQKSRRSYAGVGWRRLHRQERSQVKPNCLCVLLYVCVRIFYVCMFQLFSVRVVLSFLASGCACVFFLCAMQVQICSRVFANCLCLNTYFYKSLNLRLCLSACACLQICTRLWRWCVGLMVLRDYLGLVRFVIFLFIPQYLSQFPLQVLDLRDCRSGRWGSVQRASV